MEHLDTTCSPSSARNTKKALYLGVKLQVRQQKKRHDEKGTAERKKALCSPYITFWARCRSRRFGWRMECRQGRSFAVWGQLQGMSSARKTEFEAWHAERRVEHYGLRQVLERVLEDEHGGRKRLFTYEGPALG